MNFNKICFYDFETCSKNANKTQPIQLASIMIDGRRLEIIEDSEFNSLIKPLDDDEALKLGLDPVQDEALKVNKKTREELKTAPSIHEVGTAFAEYIRKYSTKNKWDNPIKAGYNNNNYDDIILNRMGQQPYNCIPFDKEWGRESLFHPFHSIDLMKIVWLWTENIKINQTNSLSFDNVRAWLGLESNNAHDALEDCKLGSKVLIKFMNLSRNLSKKIKFSNSMSK